MVNVTKPVAKTNAQTQTQSTTKQRRPRNTELNSSRSRTSAIASVSLATIRKLNCSRESVLQELCHWLSEEEAKKYLEAFENETGAQVVRLASPEEAGLDGDFWAVKDGKEQLWYRTDGKWYTKDDMNGSCDKTNADSSLNCEVGSTKVLGTVTIYNDFADLDNDTTERLLRSRIEKAVPGAKVDFEKVNNTDVKVKIDCPDADAEKARQAVESSDVTKSVDWESATEELDSAKGTNKTTGSTTLNSSEEPEGNTDGGDVVGEVSEEVAMITTESGNEVALDDIKIVQNPDTNELALFVKETEDDEIPEGFVVIADAAQAALPTDAACPECGQEPCVCEGDVTPTKQSVDSSIEPSTADVNKPKKQFQVYYEDENGNEIEKPAVITVSDNLEGMDLYEAIQEQFEVEYPGCIWTTVCDMNDEVKMDSSRKSELNSSVHDNPALKLFVEKIKEGAKQVSTVPTTEGEGSGYKIIIRGMEPTEIEPIAAEFGIQLSGIKPLEDGFAVVVDNDSLNSSEVDLDDSIVDDGAMRYKDYLITGGEKSGGYIAVSPYGKFSPHIYKTIDECKAAIDKDIKFRFPEQ